MRSRTAKQGSYRDKLLGAILGAFEQAFGFESSMQENLELDTEEDNPHEGSTRVCFSKEEKALIRAHGNMHSSSNHLVGKSVFFF